MIRGIAGCILSVVCLNSQVNVLTYHSDLSRTGQNLNETILTPARLQAGEFGPLFSYPVDGQVYGQPLYMWGLNVPGKGLHNVVFIVTEHNSVYAFDADQSASPLWQASFINPAAGITSAPANTLGCQAITPEVGITGTPVIDPSTGTLYVVAMTLEDFGQTYVHRLHALDVATGEEKPGSPVVIEASLPGTGDGTTAVTFKPWLYKERAGLLLLNGVVYTSWSSHCDSGNYHGWLISYDAKTLDRVAVYTSTPNWEAGSIWQSGAAPAADGNGNIYIVTGNGTFDAAAGGADLGDSVIKLSVSHGLRVTDYFTPFNAGQLDVKDIDLGSSGALLLPDSAGTSQHPHILVTGGKEGRIYVIDRESMGHFSPSGDSQIVQSLPTAIGPLYGIPAYFNNTVFFSGQNDALKAFPLSKGLLAEAPSSQSGAAIPGMGSVPSISANGGMDGIVWSIQRDGLHAYDATNLANELYRGSFTGPYIKFSTPTIANGKVYVGTGNSVAVFGLPNSPGINVILNSAGNGAGAVAPGSIVSVYGTNLATAAEAASQNPLPTVLGDTRILINGLPAPLLSASPGQINAQIPYETLGGIATVVALRGTSQSAPAALKVQETAPGIFVALNQDGTVNGSGHAAAPGSTLLVFATGLGPTEPSVPTGVAAPAGSPASVIVPLSAGMGGEKTAVLSAGLTPGMVGVFNVTLIVPDLAPGNYALAIQAGGAQSNSLTVIIGLQ